MDVGMASRKKVKRQKRKKRRLGMCESTPWKEPKPGGTVYGNHAKASAEKHAK